MRRETFERVANVVTGLLGCFGRATPTHSIMFRGEFSKDWSQDYRVFTEPAWDAPDLFIPAISVAFEPVPAAPKLKPGETLTEREFRT